MKSWALLLACCVVGCGDDPPAGIASATTVPLEWSAGDKLGMVLVEDQTKDPATLVEERCGYYIQIAQAGIDGVFPRSDEEGSCIVTQTAAELRLQEAFEPLCVGDVRLGVGSVNQNITLCGDSIPDRIDEPCEDLRGSQIRFAAPGGELALESLEDIDETLDTAMRPVLMSPATEGDGTGPWPTGELLIGWGGFGAEGVEIVLKTRDGGGPEVHCFVPDTGSFTIPERLVAEYRDRISVVEIARIRQRIVMAGEVELRISSRVSDAGWLFPR